MKINILNCISTYQYQIVALLLFFLGLSGVILSRNLLKIFICIEFIINAINILFISFASYKSDSMYLGYTISIFTTLISALVLAIGLYFTFHIYRHFGTINIREIYKLYGGDNKC